MREAYTLELRCEHRRAIKPEALLFIHPAMHDTTIPCLRRRRYEYVAANGLSIDVVRRHVHDRATREGWQVGNTDPHDYEVDRRTLCPEHRPLS